MRGMNDICSGQGLILSKSEAAEHLKVPETTIDNLHRTGQLRGVLIGRHLRWKRADVETFVTELGGEN